MSPGRLQYLDRVWQAYLDQLLPYTLHNDYPHVRQTAVEPIDNVYDWSMSPSAFVPFKPSPDNYQIPGAGRSWNTRSIHMGSVTQALMDQIFAAAAKGADQVPCLWGHLPEEDFLANIARMDSLAHVSASRYPAVRFRYCSATEAMQRWRRGADTLAPQVTLMQVKTGLFAMDITVSEPVYQAQPFVAVKDVYERSLVLPCTARGNGLWEVRTTIPAWTVAKVGVAVTDTAGNLTIETLRFLPDDRYIDNLEPEYAETEGSWTTSTAKAWGINSRMATLAAGGRAAVRWQPVIGATRRYNLFYQAPAASASQLAGGLRFRVLTDGAVVDSARVEAVPAAGGWVYVGTPLLTQGAQNSIEMDVSAAGQEGKVVYADVLKVSALVRERQMVLSQRHMDLGSIAERDTVRAELRVTNQGTGTLRIASIQPSSPLLSVGSALPLDVPPMGSATIRFALTAPPFQGSPRDLLSDSLLISSDDPIAPEVSVGVTAAVEPYFAVADNEDLATYAELSGPWSTSVAQAFGNVERLPFLRAVEHRQAAAVRAEREPALQLADVEDAVRQQAHVLRRLQSAGGRLMIVLLVQFKIVQESSRKFKRGAAAPFQFAGESVFFLVRR